MKAFDHNGTELSIHDAVMCINNGTENEGIVIEILPNNHIKIDGENGIITVNASDTFWLPS